MPVDYHRHDISDGVWALLEPLHIGRKSTWGRNAKDNRKFINAVFWILRTGAPWRDLPPDYRNWNNVYRHFRRWRDKGELARILIILILEPDFEWLMSDTSYVKVHSHASGEASGKQDMERIKGSLTQRYIWPWMHMVCRSESLLRQVPLVIQREHAL